MAPEHPGERGGGQEAAQEPHAGDDCGQRARRVLWATRGSRTEPRNSFPDSLLPQGDPLLLCEHGLSFVTRPCVRPTRIGRQSSRARGGASPGGGSLVCSCWTNRGGRRPPPRRRRRRKIREQPLRVTP